MKKLILATLLLLAPTIGWAQGSTKSILPACLTTNITTCVPQVEGTSVRVTDAASGTDCSTGGGDGSTPSVCVYDGSSWIPSSTTSGVFTGTSGGQITSVSASTFEFVVDGTNTVVLKAQDAADPASMIIDSGTTGSITLGTADTGFVGVDVDNLDFGIDQFNSRTVTTANRSSGSVIMDFRDYGDTDDDDMAHVSMATNCTTTTTGAEDCDLTVQVTEAGATRNAVVFDGDGDTTFAPEPADGGNAGGLHEIVGVPRIAPFSIDPGKVNTGVTNVDFGDDETPLSEWTATANVVAANEGSIWRKGSASLSLTFGATPADGDGADCALTTGNQDWSDVTDAAFGMWARCDEATDGTMLVLEITDSVAGATEVAIPAISVADHWTWVEVPIGAVADASKDAITSIAIDLTAAGAAALDTQVCYFDGLWKWDTAYENALGLDVYEEGVFSVMSIVKATGGNRVPKLEVEDTDYFVHYETGNDFLVSITDLSNDVLWGLAALEP